MDAVEVGGLRIAYERVGQGPPLVLLQGFIGDGPGTWRHQLDALSDEFTVVAWDAPGAGHSDDPPESFRLPDYAECLAGFVAALGLSRPNVAGVSFGAALALEFYGRFPSIPVNLILASGHAGWAGSLPPDVAQERLRLSLALADVSPEQRTRALLPSTHPVAVRRPGRSGAAGGGGGHPRGSPPFGAGLAARSGTCALRRGAGGVQRRGSPFLAGIAQQRSTMNPATRPVVTKGEWATR